jgi:hypothetical protein
MRPFPCKTSLFFRARRSVLRATVASRRYDAAMADLNQMAHRIVRQSTEPQEPKTPAQVNGRNGGLKGGAARAAKLSPEERSEIARKAAQTRWGN